MASRAHAPMADSAAQNGSGCGGRGARNRSNRRNVRDLAADITDYVHAEKRQKNNRAPRTLSIFG